MEVGSLVYRYEIDTSKSDATLTRIKASTDGVRKVTDQAAQATTNLGKAGTSASVGMANLTRTTNEARTQVTSLGAGMRDLTTGMLGSNIAAVTLGTTIGSMLTQAVMRVAQSIVQSVDAFARLRNQLIETQRIGTNAGAGFDAIREAAAGSKKPLDELTASYKQLAGQVDLTIVGVDRFNEVFVNYQRSLGALQSPTWGDAFKKLGDRLGLLFATGDPVKNMTSQLEVSRQLLTNKLKQEEIQDRINSMDKQSFLNLYGAVRQRREIATLEQARTGLLVRQAEIEKITKDQYEVAKTIILPAINDELQHQIGLGGKLRQDQEVLNQLRSVELKFREQGTTLGEKERADMAAKLREAQAASQITNIRDSLMSGAGLETQQYTERSRHCESFIRAGRTLPPSTTRSWMPGELQASILAHADRQAIRGHAAQRAAECG